jgi:hypothetical protein
VVSPKRWEFHLTRSKFRSAPSVPQAAKRPTVSAMSRDVDAASGGHREAGAFPGSACGPHGKLRTADLLISVANLCSSRLRVLLLPCLLAFANRPKLVVSLVPVHARKCRFNGLQKIFAVESFERHVFEHLLQLHLRDE